ncbi:MAG: type II toxin-antitoxin system PemK/MazF family toxin [Jiangellaceae bacterium]
MNRGDLHRLRDDRDNRGREQRGDRYCVIVQSDAVQRSTVIVAPTSASAEPSWIRPQIEIDGRRTFVIVEQIRAVDVQRLGPMVGRLDTVELAAVDAALLDALGLIR